MPDDSVENPRAFAVLGSKVRDELCGTQSPLGERVRIGGERYRVIGVMEVLDKLNAASFGMQDMELLGVFAQQAAIAISQAQKIELLGSAVLRELTEIADEDESQMPALAGLLADLDEGEIESGFEVNLLAELYREIGAWGDSERITLLKIMAAFAEYVRSKPRFE